MDNSDRFFNRLKVNFKSAMATLPPIIGNELINFVKGRFTDQAWIDKSRERWEQRKSKKAAGRAILVKTARLKRSPRIIRSTIDEVGMGMDVHYAKAHNDGFEGDVTVKSYTRKSYSHSKKGSGKINKSGTERMATYTKVKGSVVVKQHTRHMKIVRRRFVGQSEYLMKGLKRVSANHLFKNFFQ